MARARNERTGRSHDSEVWCCRVVADRVGTAGVVRHTGDGPDVDFRIDYSDGRLGVGEVGLAVNQAQEQQWARILKEESPQRVDLTTGSGQWAVGLASHSVRIDEFIRGIQPLINAFNLAGRSGFERDEIWLRGSDANVRAAHDLGLAYASRVDSGDPSFCIFFAPGGGGAQ